MMKMTSHSDMADNFRKWLEMWDDTIVTQDDVETQQIIRDKLLNAFAKIELFLAESNDKAMIKARGSLPARSDEARKAEALGIIENQKKQWYKDLEKISLDITYVRSILGNIYEIKNRRTHECFKLRAENAQLREEVKRLQER
ncbi:hypothetical protein [Chryseobacterium sp. EO14]|uniref:hypothetical protein n=1 Tax=Chryseobacterium sp. EO14 TaxID=2950551 RepID=UPI00210DC5EE|nr:hypothetical protein [Chryseobacterium sp. EO14]MCQ4139201.1 hypothetical protein [Chryseobacterium sp. EO14]